MPIPELKKSVDDCEMDELSPRPPPKPLINMPNLTISVMNESESDDSDADSSDSSAEDMMTAEEEAAARRYLSGASQPEQRRMSSLDVYLMQPQTSAESMIINRRLSMRDEENEIARMNSEEYLRQQEEERQEQLRKEREAVKRAREAKAESKLKTPTSPSPSPRRSVFRKHGIGGLSKDRRKKLREIIMRKAREELQTERIKEMMRREEHLHSVVPKVDIDSLTMDQIQELINQWHHQARESLGQCIEMEDRLRRQEEEICRMTREMIDLKGKYPKPILRKVRKTETILAKLDRLQKLNSIHHILPETSLKHAANRAPEVNTLVNGNCGESQRH